MVDALLCQVGLLKFSKNAVASVSNKMKDCQGQSDRSNK